MKIYNFIFIIFLLPYSCQNIEGVSDYKCYSEENNIDLEKLGKIPILTYKNENIKLGLSIDNIKKLCPNLKEAPKSESLNDRYTKCPGDNWFEKEDSIVLSNRDMITIFETFTFYDSLLYNYRLIFKPPAYYKLDDFKKDIVPKYKCLKKMSLETVEREYLLIIDDHYLNCFFDIENGVKNRIVKEVFIEFSYYSKENPLGY